VVHSVFEWSNGSPVYSAHEHSPENTLKEQHWK